MPGSVDNWLYGDDPQRLAGGSKVHWVDDPSTGAGGYWAPNTPDATYKSPEYTRLLAARGMTPAQIEEFYRNADSFQAKEKKSAETMDNVGFGASLAAFGGMAAFGGAGAGAAGGMGAGADAFGNFSLGGMGDGLTTATGLGAGGGATGGSMDWLDQLIQDSGGWAGDAGGGAGGYDLGGGLSVDQYGNITGGTGTNTGGSLTDTQLFGSGGMNLPSGMTDFLKKIAPGILNPDGSVNLGKLAGGAANTAASAIPGAMALNYANNQPGINTDSLTGVMGQFGGLNSNSQNSILSQMQGANPGGGLQSLLSQMRGGGAPQGGGPGYGNDVRNLQGRTIGSPTAQWGEPGFDFQPQNGGMGPYEGGPQQPGGFNPSGSLQGVLAQMQASNPGASLQQIMAQMQASNPGASLQDIMARMQASNPSGALQGILGQAQANSPLFVQAATDPVQRNIAAGYGALQQSQALRGLGGSSFGSTALSNYMDQGNRTLANAGATAAQAAINAQAGIANNMGQLSNQNFSNQANAAGMFGQLQNQNFSNQSNAAGTFGQLQNQNFANQTNAAGNIGTLQNQNMSNQINAAGQIGSLQNQNLGLQGNLSSSIYNSQLASLLGQGQLSQGLIGLQNTAQKNKNDLFGRAFSAFGNLGGNNGLGSGLDLAGLLSRGIG